MFNWIVLSDCKSIQVIFFSDTDSLPSRLCRPRRFVNTNLEICIFSRSDKFTRTRFIDIRKSGQLSMNICFEQNKLYSYNTKVMEEGFWMSISVYIVCSDVCPQNKFNLFKPVMKFRSFELWKVKCFLTCSWN